MSQLTYAHTPSIVIDRFDSTVLAATVRDAGRPVHVHLLARAVTQQEGGVRARYRRYAPGSCYKHGERIWFAGQIAEVDKVMGAQNPRQGSFSIITLILPDRTRRCMATGIRGAPCDEQPDIAEDQAQTDLDLKDPSSLVPAVRELLEADNHFVRYEDAQGEQWCLLELLPLVTEHDLRRVSAALDKRLHAGEPVSRTTEQLVEVVWSIRNDGSARYALHAFSLGRALRDWPDVVSLGDRWTHAEAWRMFTQREPMVPPRKRTQVQIPPGLEQTIRDNRAGRVRSESAIAVSQQGESIETWRSHRPREAVFTLSAHHFYEGWLPLSKEVRLLFPPLADAVQEVAFHHQFGSTAASFRAWVDHHNGRIWTSKAMYETLREHGIYPGAHLRVAYRNDREYDIATRPPASSEPIRVWRMWLEDGQIQYASELEPRRYDVKDDVFVAAVRYEDLEALFRQAEEAGNSIFGLIYQKAVGWWEANQRQKLFVTADQLFEAIHFDERGRMTSRATVGWELWRHLAFEPVGGGSYLFRPEKGDLVRSVATEVRGRIPSMSSQDRAAEPAQHTVAAMPPSPPASVSSQPIVSTSYQSDLPQDHGIIPEAEPPVQQFAEALDRQDQNLVQTDAMADAIAASTSTPSDTLSIELVVEQQDVAPDATERRDGSTPDQSQPLRIDLDVPAVSPFSPEDNVPAASPHLDDSRITSATGPAEQPPATEETTDSLWERVARLQGRELRTLPRLQAFKIIHVDERAVTIMLLGTGEGRYIGRSNIQTAWERLSAHLEAGPGRLIEYLSSDTSAYVMAILFALLSENLRAAIFDSVLPSLRTVVIDEMLPNLGAWFYQLRHRRWK